MSKLTTILPVKQCLFALSKDVIMRLVKKDFPLKPEYNPLEHFLSCLIVKTYEACGYVYSQLMLVNVSNEKIVCLEGDKVVLTICTKSGTMTSKNETINSIFDEEQKRSWVAGLTQHLTSLTFKQPVIDGAHNFLLAVEASGLRAKHTADVLWSFEINRVVKITLDGTVVVKGQTLNLTEIDISSKFCQSQCGHGQIARIIRDDPPWFVLNKDVIDKLQSGIYSLKVNELREYAGMNPPPEELLACLYEMWAAAQKIGAETLLLSEWEDDKKSNKTPCMALFDAKEKMFTNGCEVESLFSENFKSSPKFRDFIHTIKRAFKTYRELGDYYEIVPTLLQVDLSSSVKFPTTVQTEEKVMDKSVNNESGTYIKGAVLPDIKTAPLSAKHFEDKVQQNDTFETPSKVLSDTIIDKVLDQQKHIALVNCFYSWDGLVDKNVLTQGIFDRYKALNKPLTTLSLERVDLYCVKIKGLFEGEGDPVELFSFFKEPYTLQDKIRDPLFFHTEEVMLLRNWLLDNFYHTK